ncbi:hypothetical protein H4Q26_010752 [Puccinia striiformis f. sp. tritici PST-130]|nr:hypothetical protein H4Q26_010752 [Puccinia striiformis f. sp. tritici PST-130]
MGRQKELIKCGASTLRISPNQSILRSFTLRTLPHYFLPGHLSHHSIVRYSSALPTLTDLTEGSLSLLCLYFYVAKATNHARFIQQPFTGG